MPNLTAVSPLAMSPLPASLAGFALGVMLLQVQPALPPWPAALALAGAVATLCATGPWHRRRAGATACVVATLCCVLAGAAFGFGYAAVRAASRLADALPQAWEGADVVVVGVIDDLPQASERGVRFTLRVESVATRDAIVPRRLGLAWYAHWQKGGPRDPVPAVAAGERWQLVVRLKRPHGTANPHGFDVEAWLLESGIRATGYVRRDDANRRLAAFAGGAADWVQRARETVRERIRAALPESATAGVLVALAIGDQRSISPAQWEIFGRTGVTHLVSISGLHVTVFATLAGALAYALVRRSVALTGRIPARRVAVAFGVAAAFGYVLLAGAGVPAQRTLLMLLVAAIGLWIARPGSATMVWLWALAAVLVVDPWAPLAAGFWLSFGAVGLLLYGAGPRLVPAPAPTVVAGFGRRLAAAAHAQWLMTVGMVPLTLALFQQVSLVAPLANAVAIPVVTFAIVPLALAGVVLPFDPLWRMADMLLDTLVEVLAAMAQADHAVWQQHAPPPWALPLALVGIAWLAAPRGIPGRCLGWIWLLPLVVVVPARPGAGEFRMTVLDVGQGLAVVVVTRTRALLYDTGPRYAESADAGARIVVPYLRAAGVPGLDAVVVSHADADHSGGLASVLQAVPAALLLSSLPEGDDALAPVASHGNAGRCMAGQRWHWDGVTFTLLHPDSVHYASTRTRTNDLSCVLRIDSPWGSALLTGDIEAVSERELVAIDQGALRADVLVVPHHGSRTSSTPAFIAAVAPRAAVFTPGYRNRFGHPRPDVVARYAASSRHRTDLDGALTFSFAAGSTLQPQAEREQRRRYWHDLPRDGATPLD